VLRLEDGADRAEFEAWRDADPAHAEAFADAAAAWRLVGEEAAAPELLALRRDALHRARRAGRRRWGAQGVDRRAIAAGLVAAVTAPLAGWLWLKSRPAPEETYATGHGEQRTLVLADGSRVSLDALTTLRVAFSPDVRRLTLEAGRASFEAAKDPARPLKVLAGGPTVTAIGTEFTVERATPGVIVTLLEGRVAVDRAQGPRLALAPGQELTVRPDGKVSMRDGVDRDQALAWREGKLVFDDEPLGQAVARMNNYGTETLEVEGAAGELRLSGVFRAGDTRAFVEAVESYFPVRAVQTGRTIVFRPRPQGAATSPLRGPPDRAS
jgi:transmembrane sensor